MQKENDYLCIIIYRPALLGFVFPELAIERGDVDIETQSVEMSVFQVLLTVPINKLYFISFFRHHNHKKRMIWQQLN